MHSPQSTRKKREACTFDFCQRMPLETPMESLTSKEKRHRRDYHGGEKDYIFVNDMTFTLQRFPTAEHKYHCFCRCAFTEVRALKRHITGFRYKDTIRPPCQVFYERASKIASSGKIGHHPETFIDFCPSPVATKTPQNKDTTLNITLEK
jgi:hypothetical protein